MIGLSKIAANAQADAVAALLNAGYLRLYDGTQPADADTPVCSQRLLAECRFENPAFGPASAGVITAKPISKTEAVATGKATWFRFLVNDGTTTVMDGSVGIAECDLSLNDCRIQQGAELTVSNFCFTV